MRLSGIDQFHHRRNAGIIIDDAVNAGGSTVVIAKDLRILRLGQIREESVCRFLLLVRRFGRYTDRRINARQAVGRLYRIVWQLKYPDLH